MTRANKKNPPKFSAGSVFSHYDLAGLDPIIGEPCDILCVRFYSGLCTFFSALVYTRMTF